MFGNKKFKIWKNLHVMAVIAIIVLMNVVVLYSTWDDKEKEEARYAPFHKKWVKLDDSICGVVTSFLLIGMLCSAQLMIH